MLVYVHGNCQAPAIASLLAEVQPDWTILSYEVFADKIMNEIDRYHAVVAEADVIICQPVQDGYRDREDLSSNWVRANARPDCAFLVYPSMFFVGQLVGWRSVAIPGFGMAYQDMIALHCAALGVSWPRIAAIVSDEELYSAAFIDQEIDLSIAEMERREESHEIDIRLSPFLRQYARNARLFHVINHPYRQPLAYVTNEVLRKLGYPPAVSYHGPELIPFPHVPLPAPMQRFLRQAKEVPTGWEVANPHNYHLPQEQMVRAEYVRRLAAHLKSYSRLEMLEQLRQPHVLPFMQRIAATAPGIPGIEIWRHEDRIGS